MTFPSGRFVRRVGASWMLATTALCASAADCELERMGWLAGRWGGADGGTTSVEIWSEPAGGVMLGLHHDRRGDGRTFRESLRIEQRGDLCVYVARPQGAPAALRPSAKPKSRSAAYSKSPACFCMVGSK